MTRGELGQAADGAGLGLTLNLDSRLSVALGFDVEKIVDPTLCDAVEFGFHDLLAEFSRGPQSAE